MCNLLGYKMIDHILLYTHFLHIFFYFPAFCCIFQRSNLDEAVVRKCSVKNVFLKILQNSQKNIFAGVFFFFHDGGRYQIETSPLICRANQWTGFYIVTASVLKELIKLQVGNIKLSELEVFCEKRCSQIYSKFHRKATVLESLFNKVTCLRNNSYFEFLRAPLILKNIFERLPL